MTPPLLENKWNKEGSAFVLPSPWLPPGPREVSTECWGGRSLSGNNTTLSLAHSSRLEKRGNLSELSPTQPCAAFYIQGGGAAEPSPAMQAQVRAGMCHRSWLAGGNWPSPVLMKPGMGPWGEWGRTYSRRWEPESWAAPATPPGTRGPGRPARLLGLRWPTPLWVPPQVRGALK